MSEKHPVVVVYCTEGDAQAAVKDLQRDGFRMKKLSLGGKEYQTEQYLGFYDAGTRRRYWGTKRAFWGGLWGFLVGAAFFVGPCIGTLVVSRPVVAQSTQGAFRPVPPALLRLPDTIRITFAVSPEKLQAASSFRIS